MRTPKWKPSLQCSLSQLPLLMKLLHHQHLYIDPLHPQTVETTPTDHVCAFTRPSQLFMRLLNDNGIQLAQLTTGTGM